MLIILLLSLTIDLFLRLSLCRPVCLEREDQSCHVDSQGEREIVDRADRARAFAANSE